MPKTLTATTWTPFTPAGEVCTLHDDWSKLPAGNPIVLGPDLFAPWDGLIQGEAGCLLFLCRCGQHNYGNYCLSCGHACYDATLSGLRQSIFRIIDQHPDTRFILPTGNLGLVWEAWPKGVCDCGKPDGEHDDDCYYNDALPRPNVTLAAIVDNQHEADTMIRFLTEVLRDLAGGMGVFYSGLEPLVNLLQWHDLWKLNTLILAPGEANWKARRCSSCSEYRSGLMRLGDECMFCGGKLDEPTQLQKNLDSAGRAAEAASVEVLEL